MRISIILISLLTLFANTTVSAQSVMETSIPDSIRLAPDTESQIVDLLELSNNLHKRSEFDSAFFFLSEAEKLALSLDDRHLLADVKHQFGRLYDSKSKYGESEHYYQQAIDLYLSESDTAEVAKSYNRLGVSWKHLGKYSKAFGALNTALKYYLYLDDSLGRASCQINIGNVFKNIGKPEQAIEAYHDAEQIFFIYNNETQVGNCFNNLGNVYKNEGEYDSAFFYMYKTMQIRLETEDEKRLSYIYHNLANLHIQVNDLDSAQHYIEQSYTLKQSLSDSYGQALDLSVFSSIAGKKGEWQKAVDFNENALLLISGLEDYEFEIELHKGLAAGYYELGQFKKSAFYYQAYFNSESKLLELNSDKNLEYEFIEYELLSDSIQKQQILLQKELQEAENQNEQLSNQIFKRNVFILIIGLLLVLLFVIPIAIRYRTKLQLARASHDKLEKSSVPKEEKEILLKEVHHRVKNNFQIINSLIRIQAGFMKPDNYKEKLKEIETRIRSMSLIHEKLYKNDNISKLNVKEYLTDLSHYILESYETKSKLQFDIQVEEVEYGIDSLIPLGLIMNETISNAIKHAFEDQLEGKIAVILENSTENTTLEISDNGIGADLSLDELKEESLGLELILDLTDQLDGQLQLNTDNGFSYKFIFPPLK